MEQLVQKLKIISRGSAHMMLGQPLYIVAARSYDNPTNYNGICHVLHMS